MVANTSIKPDRKNTGQVNVNEHHESMFTLAVRALRRDPDTGRIRILKHMQAIENPKDLISLWLGLKRDGIDLRLRDGPTIFLNSGNEYRQLTGLIRETFLLGQYSFLAENIAKDSVVVDIGASIGDTAIYFAKHPSVEKVYAYEAYPYAYSMAARNLLSNNINGKVKLINAAVLGYDSTITVTEGATTPSSPLRKADKGRVVEVLSLDSILSSIDSNRIALKVDCEGSEYDIFGAMPDLSKVYLMQVEYHSNAEGSHAQLVELFENCGFSVSTSNGVDTVTKYNDFGFIYATRG